MTRPSGAQEHPDEPSEPTAPTESSELSEPGAPEPAWEQRREKAFSVIALIAVSAYFLGFCANLAAWSAADRIDFALNAERVPATVVGVRDGSPEVRFTTGTGAPTVATAAGEHEPGSPLDITVYLHRGDPEQVSAVHPLSSPTWVPIGTGILAALLGTVLGVRRLLWARRRLRHAARERGADDTGRPSRGSARAWSAASAAFTAAAAVIAVLIAAQQDPTPDSTEKPAAVLAVCLAYAVAAGVKALLVRAARTPAPAGTGEPRPPAGERLLIGGLALLACGVLVSLVATGVYEGGEWRLAGHETVVQEATVVDSSTVETGRRGCGGRVGVSYEVDGLPYTSTAHTDCDTAQETETGTGIEVLRSVSDPSLVALEKDVR